MKNLLKHTTGWMIPFCLATFLAFAGIFEDISLAINSGNAKEISQFFGAQVNLKIKQTQDVYNKTEAEIKLKNFFMENDPRDFNIIHKGSSKGKAQYAIGSLKTNNGSFRTYILVKQQGNKRIIKELSFERD